MKTLLNILYLPGIWFIVVGQVLYPVNGEPWDESSHDSIQTMMILFCTTIGISVIFSFALGVVMYRIGSIGRSKYIGNFKKSDINDLLNDEEDEFLGQMWKHTAYFKKRSVILCSRWIWKKCFWSYWFKIFPISAFWLNEKYMGQMWKQWKCNMVTYQWCMAQDMHNRSIIWPSFLHGVWSKNKILHCLYTK